MKKNAINKEFQRIISMLSFTGNSSPILSIQIGVNLEGAIRNKVFKKSVRLPRQRGKMVQDHISEWQKLFDCKEQKGKRYSKGHITCS
jgi:hypothetical protein